MYIENWKQLYNYRYRQAIIKDRGACSMCLDGICLDREEVNRCFKFHRTSELDKYEIVKATFICNAYREYTRRVLDERLKQKARNTQTTIFDIINK